MSPTWKKCLDRVLEKGEIVGLIGMTLMLIVTEACLVYWLNHLQLFGQSPAPSGFLAMPPWYRRPRFEVTLQLTIAAGSLFRVCGSLWAAWRHRNHATAAEWLKSLRRQIKTATSVTVIAGFNLALATWLR